MYYRAINGHPDYVARDDGCIFRIHGDGRINLESPLSPEYSTGKARVRLDGKNAVVGRIIGEAFVDHLIPEATIIFHSDLDQHNNAAYNLVWITPREAQKFVNGVPNYVTQETITELRKKSI